MNFLAHLYLSCGDDDLLIGNFIADFISNKEIEKYSPEIQEGIFLHRAIDNFTDNHLIVRKSISRLYDSQGKYASVVIDILFDHLLAKFWNEYSEITLIDFASQVYDLFNLRFNELPIKLQRILPSMMENNFLESYETLAGLRFTLEKMDQRTKFPSNFPSSISVLYNNLSEFESEFKEFFPSVIEYVDAKCKY